MNKLLCLVLIISALVLVGCSSFKSTDLINLIIPADSYIKQQVKYSNLERQGLDIYLPKTEETKTPIVFVYGGAWRHGDKKDYEFVAHALTNLGHPVIIPDYRLYPEVKFPEFVDDIAMAIKYIETKALQYLKKPLTQYILMGHSSGAHTVALLATNNNYQRKYQINAKLVGLIAMAGPYDLPLEDPEVKPVFSKVSAKETNPILNIHSDLPPVLLLHGQKDVRVLPKHTHKFNRALLNNKLTVYTKLYPKVNHTQLIAHQL